MDGVIWVCEDTRNRHIFGGKIIRIHPRFDDSIPPHLMIVMSYPNSTRKNEAEMWARHGVVNRGIQVPGCQLKRD